MATFSKELSEPSVKGQQTLAPTQNNVDANIVNTGRDALGAGVKIADKVDQANQAVTNTNILSGVQEGLEGLEEDFVSAEEATVLTGVDKTLERFNNIGLRNVSRANESKMRKEAFLKTQMDQFPHLRDEILKRGQQTLGLNVIGSSARIREAREKEFAKTTAGKRDALDKYAQSQLKFPPGYIFTKDGQARASTLQTGMRIVQDLKLQKEERDLKNDLFNIPPSIKDKAASIAKLVANNTVKSSTLLDTTFLKLGVTAEQLKGGLTVELYHKIGPDKLQRAQAIMTEAMGAAKLEAISLFGDDKDFKEDAIAQASAPYEAILAALDQESSLKVITQNATFAAVELEGRLPQGYKNAMAVFKLAGLPLPDTLAVKVADAAEALKPLTALITPEVEEVPVNEVKDLDAETITGLAQLLNDMTNTAKNTLDNPAIAADTKVKVTSALSKLADAMLTGKATKPAVDAWVELLNNPANLDIIKEAQRGSPFLKATIPQFLSQHITKSINTSSLKIERAMESFTGTTTTTPFFQRPIIGDDPGEHEVSLFTTTVDETTGLVSIEIDQAAIEKTSSQHLLDPTDRGVLLAQGKLRKQLNKLNNNLVVDINESITAMAAAQGISTKQAAALLLRGTVFANADMFGVGSKDKSEKTKELEEIVNSDKTTEMLQQQKTLQGNDKKALRTFGVRVDGTPKGAGYFGVLNRPDGQVSTELSIGIELDGKEVEMPALVPTLSKQEITSLLSGEKISKAIINKAVRHAQMRIQKGLSPFAQGEEDIVAIN